MTKAPAETIWLVEIVAADSQSPSCKSVPKFKFIDWKKKSLTEKSLGHGLESHVALVQACLLLVKMLQCPIAIGWEYF